MEATDTLKPKKQKIVILGGGVSAMTTAMQLTEEPNWQEKYEITLYQMGWRLGGKGASGRNTDIANRIEEHGLHLWFGFYDNAFDLIQRCYADNNRPLTKPLATWQEAFKPFDIVVLEEYVWDKWEHWPLLLPRNDEMPGLNGPPPTVWEYVRHILAALHVQHINYFKSQGKNKKTSSAAAPTSKNLNLWERISNLFSGQKNPELENEHDTFFKGIEQWWEKIEHSIEAVGLEISGRLILTALRIVESLISKNPTHHSILLDIIDRILRWLWLKIEHEIDEDPETRHLWVTTDFALSTIRGMIVDGVITEGFDVINNIDFRDWIKKHGASAITIDSGLVQAVYGLVFGGYKYFTFEAGTALRGAMRMAFTYRGSVYYRMQAGMGDTIFAPMYEVLKARGVKFEFFNKVKNLKLSSDKKNIESIEIGIQATVKNNQEYNPLFDVKGLPCWPSNPLYDQLDQGEQLKEFNLESYWTPWQDVGTKTLQAGVDFDIVVQGIAIGALPVIAKELIAENEDWKKMVESVTACETNAFQLWFYPDVAGLGWPYWMNEVPLSGSYKEPFDTWADMSDLIIRESWPDHAFPNNIAYVCGPIETKVDYSKWDFNDHTVPMKAYEEVKNKTKDYLEKLSPHLWPNASDGNGNFNWDLLIDLNNRIGVDRFNSQWFKANIDPSELYVLSETNSSIHRMKTHPCGFDNLYITGDWIDNGFNAGCVEAAVIAGKQTAREILQQEHEIMGENDPV